MVRSAVRDRKLFAGERLRRLRNAAGERQVALAKAVGISPSYLSQIESDQRSLPHALMQRLCEHFRVGTDYFGEDEDQRRVQDLREAMGDPVFGGTAVDLAEIQSAVRTAPNLAQQFLSLHHAYSTQRERMQELYGHQSHSGGVRAPYEEVREWVQLRNNYFHNLDRAAEIAADDMASSGTELRESLTRRLLDLHGLVIAADPSLLMQGMVWQLDRRGRRLLIAESAAPESSVFWVAHVLGQLEHRRLIDSEVHSGHFSTSDARALAKVALGNYFAGALMFPYARFLETAEAVRYDIERLQARYRAGFEQVCHRLSTLQRPNHSGIPFFFAKTDIAGNILKRSSATRFQFSRLGGPCPLWNVYRTFANPGQLLVQLAQTPDGLVYLNIARTVTRGGGSHLARPRIVAVVLGCGVEHAVRTVYATGLNLTDESSAVPIGPGCRACERTACRHRAVPPAGHRLDVGTEERGVVPYRIDAVHTNPRGQV